MLLSKGEVFTVLLSLFSIFLTLFYRDTAEFASACQSFNYFHQTNNLAQSKFKPELTISIESGAITNITSSDIFVPIVIKLKVDNLEENIFELTHIDLVFVIDFNRCLKTSDSLQIKYELNRVLNMLGPQDRASIVTLEKEGQIVSPLTLMTAQNKEKIVDIIQNIRLSEESRIDWGLKTAIEVLRNRTGQNRVTSIFLFSCTLIDQAYYSIPQIIKEADDLKTFSIHTFGFGPDHDSKLLAHTISALKQGSYQYIEDLSDLHYHFGVTLVGLRSVIADEILISVSSAVSLQTAKLYPFPEGRDLWQNIGDNFYFTRIRQFQAGSEKSLLLNLEMKSPFLYLNEFPGSKVIEAFSEIVWGPANILDSKVATLELNQLLSNKENNLSILKLQAGRVLAQAHILADRREREKAIRIVKEFLFELERADITEKYSLIMDLKKALEELESETYDNQGRHSLVGSSMAHLFQSPYFQHDKPYLSSSQSEYLRLHQVQEYCLQREYRQNRKFK